VSGQQQNDQLRRLHPLTPLLRGFKVFGAIVAIVSYRTLVQVGWQRAAIAVPIIIVLALLVSWVSWRYTGYRIAGNELHIESGVLRRRSRHVPLERIQAIDVVRPLVGRVLGLAELRIEVVGHGETEAPLAYLTDAEAHQLRARLLALAAGVDEHAPAPEESVLAEVSTKDLVVSVLLLGPIAVALPIFLVLAVVLAAVSLPAFLGLLGAFASVGLGFGQVAVRRLLGEYGFTVADSPDGLRLRHGLLETRAQTVPPGRVQAARVSQPLLWRRRDWVRVEVDVAGYGGGREEQQATHALLPVAPRGLAYAVLHRVLPGVDVAGAELVPAPRRARWRAPIQHTRLAAGTSPTVLISRSGRVQRVVDVVPYARAQSIRRTQGPWQRRLGLASVHVDTAGRRIFPVALHRDAAEAERLVGHLAGLARAERERRRVARQR
jgi:putative membrane protein